MSHDISPSWTHDISPSWRFIDWQRLERTSAGAGIAVENLAEFVDELALFMLKHSMFWVPCVLYRKLVCNWSLDCFGSLSVFSNGLANEYLVPTAGTFVFTLDQVPTFLPTESLTWK